MRVTPSGCKDIENLSLQEGLKSFKSVYIGYEDQALFKINDTP